MGKCYTAVIEAVGRPDRTQLSGRNEYWYYAGKTTDPVTSKIDRSAQVVFEDMCVVRVNFD